jgi:hypothetical protein
MPSNACSHHLCLHLIHLKFILGLWKVFTLRKKTQDVMVKNNELQIYVILFLLWVKQLKINVIKITIQVCHQNNSKIFQQSKVSKDIFH